MKKLIPFLVLILIALVALTVLPASANHAWGKYHWNLSTKQTETNPLVLGNNLTTPAWRSSLSGAASDWDQSVLHNAVVAGNNTSCNPVLGQVEVCNSAYGDNGWLGIAQIWAYRGKDAHIAQALVKVNDTYFNTASYNSSAWRNLVMCQEVGHTFGLDHQDENFSNTNLGTCMDYTNDPDGSLYGQLNNEHPNLHDYDMLTQIYAHLNGTGGGGGKPGKGKNGNKPAGVGADIDLNNPTAWGRGVSQDAQGKTSLFERDLGNGMVLITHVIWVQ